MKNLLNIQAKALVLTAILLISIAGMLSAQKIAIIDAGSSGSRLYVYEIKEGSNELKVLYPAKEQEATSKGRALSSVANHKDSVSVFLTTMADKYKGEKGKKIPLYVLATAGMRMLSKDKADSIYEKMNSQVREFGVFLLDTAMTISGRYEGFYAWIAANCKKEGVSKYPLTFPESTYGILEIGGASMQIAFAVDGNSDSCISRKGFNIYSKSYLGGGVDQIYNNNKENKATPNFTVSLNKVDNLYKQNLKFFGLGKPIEIVLNSANDKNHSALEYAKSLTNNDSEKNFHPWINAHYIAWVIDSLKLNKKLTIPNEKSDWTEGAVLDILINKEKPEGFNYQIKN